MSFEDFLPWCRLLNSKDTDIEKYIRLLKGLGLSELECPPTDNGLVKKLPSGKYHRGNYYHDWESIVLDLGTPYESLVWMHFDRWGQFIIYGV